MVSHRTRGTKNVQEVGLSPILSLPTLLIRQGTYTYRTVGRAGPTIGWDIRPTQSSEEHICCATLPGYIPNTHML